MAKKRLLVVLLVLVMGTLFISPNQISSLPKAQADGAVCATGEDIVGTVTAPFAIILDGGYFIEAVWVKQVGVDDAGGCLYYDFDTVDACYAIGGIDTNIATVQKVGGDECKDILYVQGWKWEIKTPEPTTTKVTVTPTTPAPTTPAPTTPAPTTPAPTTPAPTTPAPTTPAPTTPAPTTPAPTTPAPTTPAPTTPAATTPAPTTPAPTTPAPTTPAPTTPAPTTPAPTTPAPTTPAPTTPAPTTPAPTTPAPTQAPTEVKNEEGGPSGAIPVAQNAGVCQDLVLTTAEDLVDGELVQTIGTVDDTLFNQGDVELYPGHSPSLAPSLHWYAGVENGDVYAASTMQDNWYLPITNDGTQVDDRDPSAGDFSPKVVFKRFDAELGTYVIALWDTENVTLLRDQNGQLLQVDPEVAIVWEPRWWSEIAYVQSDGNLAIYSLVDQSVRTLAGFTRLGKITQLDWDHSTALAYTYQVGREGETDLAILNPNDGDEIAVIERPGSQQMPAISPDGFYLAFITSERGGNELAVISIGDFRTIYYLTDHVRAGVINPTWYCGHTIYFQSFFDLDLNVKTPNSEVYRLTLADTFLAVDVSNNKDTQLLSSDVKPTHTSEGLSRPHRILYGVVNGLNNDDGDEEEMCEVQSLRDAVSNSIKIQ